MKRLAALLAFLAFAPGVYASASMTTAKSNADVTQNGQFRARYTLDMDKDGNSDAAPGSVGKEENRFDYGATFRVGDKLTGHLGLIYAGQMGQTSVPTDGSTTAQLSTANSSNNLLGVYEAYGAWQLNDAWMIKAGRFGLEIGDGMVISKDDWQQHPNSFDGALVGYETEFAKFQLFGLKHYDWGTGNTVPNRDAEENSYGLSVDVKSVPDALKTVNVHVIQTNADQVNDGTTARNGKSITRYGITLGGATTGVDYHLTYAGLSGKTIDAGTAAKTNRDGSMLDAKVGYTFADLMNFRIHVGYHMDSGTKSSSSKNSTYDPFFYDAHKYAGLQDVLEWGNLTDLNVGVSLDPMEDFCIGLNYHQFTASEKTDATNVVNTGWTRVSGKDDLGSEFDLKLSHKYANGLDMALRYSSFSAGNGLQLSSTNTDKPDTYSQVFLQGTMHF